MTKKNENWVILEDEDGTERLDCMSQGDLLFVRCKGLPPDGKIKESGILVEGTSQGHLHRIEPDVGAAVYEYKDGNLHVASVKYFSIQHVNQNGTRVMPEEHADVNLEEGVWEVLRQVETTPEGFLRMIED